MTRTLPSVALVLLAILVVGGAQVLTRTTGARTVELTIEHSRFRDADGRALGTLTVRPGETVRFVVTNRDPIDHELIAGDLGTQLRHEAGTDRHHDGAHGAVSVAPGETAATVHTFGAAGTSYLGCHLPGHWDYGMREPVAVR